VSFKDFRGQPAPMPFPSALYFKWAYCLGANNARLLFEMTLFHLFFLGKRWEPSGYDRSPLRGLVEKTPPPPGSFFCSVSRDAVKASPGVAPNRLRCLKEAFVGVPGCSPHRRQA